MNDLAATVAMIERVYPEALRRLERIEALVQALHDRLDTLERALRARGSL